MRKEAPDRRVYRRDVLGRSLLACYLYSPDGAMPIKSGLNSKTGSMGNNHSVHPVWMKVWVRTVGPSRGDVGTICPVPKLGSNSRSTAPGQVRSDINAPRPKSRLVRRSAHVMILRLHVSGELDCLLTYGRCDDDGPPAVRGKKYPPGGISLVDECRLWLLETTMCKASQAANKEGQYGSCQMPARMARSVSFLGQQRNQRGSRSATLR